MWPLILASAAGAAEPPAAVLPSPEPVESWARADLRADRRARAGLLITLSAPGLVVVGTAASVGFRDQSGAEVERGFGDVLLGAGLVGAVIGPPLLLEGTWRSSVALRRQALSVPTGALVVGASLYAGTVVLFALDREPEAGRAVLLGGGYIGAVGFGAAQLRRNQIARHDAGWFGVVPVRVGDASGLAVAGSF